MILYQLLAVMWSKYMEYNSISISPITGTSITIQLMGIEEGKQETDPQMALKIVMSYPWRYSLFLAVTGA